MAGKNEGNEGRKNVGEKGEEGGKPPATRKNCSRNCLAIVPLSAGIRIGHVPRHYKGNLSDTVTRV